MITNFNAEVREIMGIIPDITERDAAEMVTNINSYEGPQALSVTF